MVYLRLENIVCSSIYSISLLSSRFKLRWIIGWMYLIEPLLHITQRHCQNWLIDLAGKFELDVYIRLAAFSFSICKQKRDHVSQQVYSYGLYHKLRHRVSLPPLIGRLTTQRMNEWMRMLMCVCVSSSWVGYLIFKWFHWKIIKK